MPYLGHRQLFTRFVPIRIEGVFQNGTRDYEGESGSALRSPPRSPELVYIEAQALLLLASKRAWHQRWQGIGILHRGYK